MDQLSEKKYKALVLEKKKEAVIEEDAMEGQEKDKLLTIAHLKGLVLSIDWEISSSVLGYFTRELNRLKFVWKQERIYRVYLQAMEKLARYVYVEKGEAHPGAIKLLLSLYQNLERLLIETEWDEERRKAFLQEDIRRFELLQEQICYGVIDNSPDSDWKNDKESGESVSHVQPSSPPPVEIATGGAIASELTITQTSAELRKNDVWEEDVLPQKPFVAKEIALQGIEVDSEADDGIDDEDLPLQDGELAPALADITVKGAQLEVDSEIESTVSSFFGEEEVEVIPEGLSLELEEKQQVLQKEDEVPTELSFEHKEEPQGGGEISEISLVAEDHPEEISQGEEFVLEEQLAKEEFYDDLLAMPDRDNGEDEDDSEQLALVDFGEEKEDGLVSERGKGFVENLVEEDSAEEGEKRDCTIDTVDLLDITTDSVVSVSGDSVEQNVALLVEYCEKLSKNRDDALLTAISPLHDYLLEKMEGRPLELHILLLFTAVADLLQQRLKDDEPVLLLVSIAKTLKKVLCEEDRLSAQRLLLRESAAVLDWISSLVE